MKTTNNPLVFPIMVIPALLATGLSLFVLLANADNVAAKPSSHIAATPIRQIALTQEPKILMVQPLMRRPEPADEVRNSRVASLASAKQTADYRTSFHRVKSIIVGNRTYAFS